MTFFLLVDVLAWACELRKENVTPFRQRDWTQKLVNTGIHAALLLLSPFYALFAVWMSV